MNTLSSKQVSSNESNKYTCISTKCTMCTTNALLKGLRPKPGMRCSNCVFQPDGSLQSTVWWGGCEAMPLSVFLASWSLQRYGLSALGSGALIKNYQPWLKCDCPVQIILTPKMICAFQLRRDSHAVLFARPGALTQARGSAFLHALQSLPSTRLTPVPPQWAPLWWKKILKGRTNEQ